MPKDKLVKTGLIARTRERLVKMIWEPWSPEVKRAEIDKLLRGFEKTIRASSGE